MDNLLIEPKKPKHNELICEHGIMPLGGDRHNHISLSGEVRRSYVEKNGFDLLLHVEDLRISSDLRLTGIDVETLTELSNMFHLLSQKLYLKTHEN